MSMFDVDYRNQDIQATNYVIHPRRFPPWESYTDFITWSHLKKNITFSRNQDRAHPTKRDHYNVNGTLCEPSIPCIHCLVCKGIQAALWPSLAWCCPQDGLEDMSLSAFVSRPFESRKRSSQILHLIHLWSFVSISTWIRETVDCRLDVFMTQWKQWKYRYFTLSFWNPWKSSFIQRGIGCVLFPYCVCSIKFPILIRINRSIVGLAALNMLHVDALPRIGRKRVLSMDTESCFQYRNST